MGLDWAVTGSGRSGTSFVAKVLMDNGVCMGKRLDVQTSEKHLYGNREDKDMLRAHVQLLSRRMSPEAWLEKWQGLHRKCKGPCGIKQPDMAFFDLDDWEVIKPRRLIWCWRKPRQVTESMIRCGALDRIWRIHPAQRRLERLLDVGKVTVLDMSERRSSEWVLDAVNFPRPKGSGKMENVDE